LGDWGLRESYRLKYWPKIAEWIVRQSTGRARSKLAGHAPVGILVDNTVLYHAVTHETGWVSTGERHWGPHPIDTGYAARIPVHAPDDPSREYRNVQYLPGIAYLSRIGALTLYTSAELQDEQFRQPSGRYRGYGYSDLGIFGGLTIDSVDGWVFPHLGPKYLNLPTPREQQRRRLENYMDDGTYAALVQRLGKKNSQDAWHIYTAEKHGLFCFLTMDFRLIETVAAQARTDPVKSFTTRVITPEGFGKEFELRRIPPRILSLTTPAFLFDPTSRCRWASGGP